MLNCSPHLKAKGKRRISEIVQYFKRGSHPVWHHMPSWLYYYYITMCCVTRDGLLTGFAYSLWHFFTNHWYHAIFTSDNNCDSNYVILWYFLYNQYHGNLIIVTTIIMTNNYYVIFSLPLVNINFAMIIVNTFVTHVSHTSS